MCKLLLSQSSSAVYSLGRVPSHSLLCWDGAEMCQLSNRHCVVTKGCVSITSALDRSLGDPWTTRAQLEQMQQHPISECMLVFSQPVLEGSARLSNIHLGALRAGDFVDHTCALVPGYRVL